MNKLHTDARASFIVDVTSCFPNQIITSRVGYRYYKPLLNKIKRKKGSEFCELNSITNSLLEYKEISKLYFTNVVFSGALSHSSEKKSKRINKESVDKTTRLHVPRNLCPKA